MKNYFENILKTTLEVAIPKTYIEKAGLVTLKVFPSQDKFK